VKQLNDLCPDAVYEIDCKNRFPLHIAVDNGAPSDIQSYLIERNSFAAKVPDIDGKTPLHLLFRNYNVRRRNEPNRHLESYIFDNVKLLSDAAPMSVFAQDNGGKTVLECAISEHVEQKIQQKLQSVAVRMGRRNSTLEVKKRKSLLKKFRPCLRFNWAFAA